MTPDEIKADRATIEMLAKEGYRHERWSAALDEIVRLRARLSAEIISNDDLTAALAAMTAARDGIAEIAESYQHVAANALCGPCAVLVSVGAIELGTVEEIDALRAIGGGK